MTHHISEGDDEMPTVDDVEDETEDETNDPGHHRRHLSRHPSGNPKVDMHLHRHHCHHRSRRHRAAHHLIHDHHPKVNDHDPPRISSSVAGVMNPLHHANRMKPRFLQLEHDHGLQSVHSRHRRTTKNVVGPSAAQAPHHVDVNVQQTRYSIQH